MFFPKIQLHVLVVAPVFLIPHSVFSPSDTTTHGLWPVQLLINLRQSTIGPEAEVRCARYRYHCWCSSIHFSCTRTVRRCPNSRKRWYLLVPWWMKMTGKARNKQLHDACMALILATINLDWERMHSQHVHFGHWIIKSHYDEVPRVQYP